MNYTEEQVRRMMFAAIGAAYGKALVEDVQNPFDACERIVDEVIREVKDKSSITYSLVIVGLDDNPHAPFNTSSEKQASFENAARPLIKWLCEHVHPHHSVIVTPTSAELLEGNCSTGQILDYVRG